MSRLDSGGGIYTTTGRRGLPVVPDTRITESLDAPGVTPLPPDLTEANATADFARLFGMSAEYAASVAREREITKARNEREQNAIDQSLIGEGANAGSLEFPGLQAQIERGEIGPVGEETSAQFAMRVVGELTAGKPEKYREGYARIANNLAASYESVKARAGDAARAMMLSSASSNAITARDAESLDGAYAGALATPGVTELQAREATYLAALRDRAARGDVAGYQALRDSGRVDLFRSSFPTLDAQAAAVAERNRTARERGALDYIDGLYNSGMSIESVMERIDAAIENGSIDNTTGRNYREMYGNKWEQQQRERMKALSEMVVEEKTRQAVDATLKIMEAGNETIGAARIAGEKMTYQTPDGNEHTLNGSDLVDEAWAAKRAQIDQSTQDPEQRMLRRIDFMRRNNGIADPEVSARAAGIASRVVPGMAVKDVPPIVRQAISDYVFLVKNGGQTIADRHAKDADRDFLRAAAYLSDVTGDAGSAAIEVAVGMRRDPAFAETITRAMDPTLLRQETEFLEGNPGEVDARAFIEQRARAYTALGGGKTPAEAIKQAVLDFHGDHIEINGYWINSSRFTGRQNPHALTTAIEAVSAAWAESKQLPVGDFVLLPQGDRKAWQMMFRGVAIDPEAPVFTDEDLMAIFAETERQRSDKEALEAMAVARTTPAVSPAGVMGDPLNIIGRMVGATKRTFGAGYESGDADKLPAPPEPPERLKFVFDYLRRKPVPADGRGRSDDTSTRPRFGGLE